MIDTPKQVLELRSVDVGSTFSHHKALNYNDVISTGVEVDVIDLTDSNIRQYGNHCSAALGEHYAHISMEPHCEEETFQRALSWIRENGFIGEPFLINTEKDGLEHWVVGKFEDSE